MKLYMHWWLTIIILSPITTGANKVYPQLHVQEYHDYAECAVQADKIFKQLSAVYPDTTQYTVQCLNTTEKEA